MKRTVKGGKKWLLVFALIAGIGVSCKKKTNDNSQNTNATVQVVSRDVKIELSGNYSGKINVVYTNMDGVTTAQTGVSLPWSISYTAKPDVSSIAVGGSTSSTSNVGVQGQTLTAKIIVGGEEKKSTTVYSDANGYIQLGSLVYLF